MEKYKDASGTVYNVAPNRIDEFKQKYPDAIKVDLPGKTDDAAVDANVASTDTDLASESILSALPKVNVDPKINPETGVEFTGWEKAGNAIAPLIPNIKNIFEATFETGVIGLDNLFTSVFPKDGVLSDLVEKSANLFLSEEERASMPEFDASTLIDGLLYQTGDYKGDGTGGRNKMGGMTAAEKEQLNKILKGEVDVVGGVAQEQQQIMDKRLEDAGAGYTGEGYLNSSAEDKLVAGLNSLVGVASTVAPAIMTRGRSLGPQIIAPMITEYNNEKAKHIYGENDPNALKKLGEDDGFEIGVPAVLGYGAYQLEKLGFKNISKFIFKQAFKPGRFVKLLKTGNVNGIQEAFQGLLENLNSNIATGQDKDEAIASVFKDNFSSFEASEEFFENYLLGLSGGVGMSSIGSGVRRALKADEPTSLKITGYIDELVKLRGLRSSTKSQDVLDSIEKRIKETEEALSEYVQHNNNLSEYLNEDQSKELEDFLKLKNEGNEKLDKLNRDFKAKKISKEEFSLAEKDILNSQNKIDSDIVKIKTDANMALLKKDLDAGGRLLKDIKGLKQEVYSDEASFMKALEAEYKAIGKKMPDFEGIRINGTKVGRKILINAQVAAETNAVATSTHEVLHGIVKSSVQDKDGSGNLSGEGVNIVNSFINQLSSSELSKIEQLLKDGDYKLNEDGSTKEFKEYGEEYLNMYAQLSKEEKLNKSGIQRAGKWFADLFREKSSFKKIGFEDGQSVRNFLDAYVEDTKLGEDATLTEKQKATRDKFRKLIKQGVKMKDTVEMSSTVNLDKGDGDVSQRIDAYTEGAKTKAEFQSGAFGNIYQGIIDGKFDRVLGEGLSSEQREIMREELADRLINYDPAKTPNLSKWMYGGKGKGGNIGFSALVAKKKLFEKGERRKSEVEGDAPSGTGQTVLEKAAETVTVKDAEVELDAEQEYSQFRQDLGLDDAMMQKVRDAVIKTFGTKLPEVSSKKFRATLEKAYRTELKKPIQDMIGSRDAFNEFLGKAYKTVFGKLPVETLIQMERNVDPEQRIFTTSRRITKPTEVDELVAKGKLPKDVNRLSGPLLITKLPYPGIKKVMAFYRGENMSEVLGYKVGASTLGTRKDKLAMEMGVELGFDATAETIQNPEVAERRADIADLQGREQAENEISIIAKQINRDPNVKFSVTSDQFSDQAMSLVNDIIDNGVESVFNPETGKIADGYEDIDKKVASFVFERLWSTGVIVDSKSVRFKAAIAKSKLVPDFIKKLYKDDGNLRYNEKALNKLHKDSSTVAKILGPEIMDAIGYEILGYKNRTMDPAEQKTGQPKGTKGKFYDRLQKLIKDVKKTKGQALPAGLNLDAISMMNKNAGVKSVFGKVEKILFEETTREKKLEKLAKLAPEIEAANEANILLAKHIAKVITNAARSGAISKVSALHLIQSQTSIVFGFRGLSRLDLITVLDGSQKPGESHPQFNGIVKELSKTMSKDDAIAEAKKLTGTKGEHLAPNSNTMLKIAELFFTSDTNAELDAKLDKIFEGHSQMHTTKHLTNVMDKKGGANNDTDFNRVKFLNKKDIDATVSADGRSYLQVLADVEIKKELSKFVNDAKAKVEEKAGVDNAVKFSRTVNESRGITVLDFDDTLATSKSNVLYTTPDGKKGKLTAEQFAKQGADLLAQGYVYDFSEFSKVVGGKTAPLFNKAMKLQGKFGPENMFVLTARPADAAPAIFAFLKANGLNIPLKNITGLANSTADAKAFWMAEKVGEGYNDFYFADDALQNVKAVKEVLEQFDVKSKVQQAKVKFSKTMDRDFNSMLERTRGIGAEKVFSRIAAEKRGKNIGKFQFFVPPSADDFAGLLRYFAGKGKQGDADIAFFKKALLDPFARADREMSMARQTILNDYKALRKKFPDVKKRLGKLMPNSDFTLDNAIRVYLWNKAGFEIPGLSKRDIEDLVARVEVDPITKAFADTLGAISKQQEGYIKPGENWSVETIAYDLQNITSKIGRKKYLEEFIENKNIIFTKENLNKIEAAYGSNFREALKDVLSRMETGTNRSSKMGRIEGKWNNWVNNSVGAIMFFNARSAVLQTLSTVNFINFENNNVFAAAKAFANQKQYWSDFSMLFNSDFLRNRRAGLATNVNEAELASAVAGAQNKAKAALQYLLKIGFTPTQIADSFAIASGGSTYYRNQVNFYLKDGMDQKAAEEQAFLNFQEIAEETQQSARPDRISQQQASSLGRIVLAFANTPMQYNRLIKKAAGDLINKRGDWRSHVSRIIYYGAAQNFIFSALQSAIFALAFDDEDDEEQLDKKTDRLLNGMLDSLLRGSGLAGAVISTIKNTALRFVAEDKKGFRADYGNVMVDAVNLSPPIGSKIRKLYSATKTYKFNKEEIMEGDKLDLENPLWDAVGNVVSATTNVPLDRAFRKIDNMKESLNSDNENWQRIAVGLGWDQWSLGIKKPGKSKRKSSRGSSRGGSGRGGSGRGN